MSGSAVDGQDKSEVKWAVRARMEADPVRLVKTVLSARTDQRVSRSLAPAWLLKGESGQAVVEFSVVLACLVLVLFSILEGGLLLNVKLELTSSAREIARICAVEGGNTGRAQETLKKILAATGIDSSQLHVDITPNQAIYGTTIYVSLTYQYRFRSPVVSALVGPTITVTARAVTRSEFVPR